MGDLMLDEAIKFIEKIESNGFKAYIVGGFVRDYLLNIKSNDIDICTNCKPNELLKIFKNANISSIDYGSVTVFKKNIRFEVTTFRKEIKYVNNRKPLEFIYIDDLLDDLKRRDFTINTICMDKNKNIIDLLNGKKDLYNMEIVTVGDSYLKFSEDALRILRAIRFATILDFKLNDNIKESIIKTKHLLKNLSYERKKEELNKIFSSKHVNYGIKLLKELDLLSILEIENVINVKDFSDLLGVWSIIDNNNYPFTKNEKELIKSIKEVLKLNNLDKLVLYKYGLYVNSVASNLKGINKKDVTYIYDNLPIKSKEEINISALEIANLLNKEPSSYLKDIIKDIETNIILGNINNNKSDLINYILNKYK